MHVSEAGSREDNYTAQYTSSKTGKTTIKKVANPVVKKESDGVLWSDSAICCIHPTETEGCNTPMQSVIIKGIFVVK
jgi:hypothetical protein